MHMKRIKCILVFVALLMIVLLLTSCGSDINLGASMSGFNGTEEASPADEEGEESTDIEEYDYEAADTDNEEDEQTNSAQEHVDEEDGQADSVEEQIIDNRIVTVILNTNKDRKRIHLENKSCSNKIGKNNRQEWTGTADELIEYARKYGYVACGSCHPERELDIDLPTKE